MKNKILEKVLVIVVLFGILGVLVGCGNKEEEKQEENKQEESKQEEEQKVALNPELDGTEVFAEDGTNLVAIKEDGSKVVIMENYLQRKKLHSLDYDNGKLYVAQIDTKVVNGKVVGPVRQQSIHVVSEGYDVIDLTKGDGNYEATNLLTYTPDEDTVISVDSPKAYKNKLYYIKNHKDIVEMNTDTLEETVLDSISRKNENMSVGLYLMIDKVNEKLYYSGFKDGKTSLMEYNLKTKEIKKIKEEDSKNHIELVQITENGLYFINTEPTNHAAKLEEYIFETGETKEISLNATFNFVVTEPYIFTQETINNENSQEYYTEPIGENFFIKDKDLNVVKEIFSKVEYNVENELYPYSKNKVQVHFGDKHYIVNTETFETKEAQDTYAVTTSIK